MASIKELLDASLENDKLISQKKKPIPFAEKKQDAPKKPETPVVPAKPAQPEPK